MFGSYTSHLFLLMEVHSFPNVWLMHRHFSSPVSYSNIGMFSTAAVPTECEEDDKEPSDHDFAIHMWRWTFSMSNGAVITLRAVSCINDTISR